MIRFCLATAASIAIAAAQCTPDMTGYPCYHNSGAPIATDLAATAGNPFKGFANNRLWSGESPRTDIESSLEFHYIGLSEVMTGADSTSFDWTVLNDLLDASAGRNMHSVLRFFVDHPNDPAVNQAHASRRGVPAYLLDDVSNPIILNEYTEHGGGFSPDYHDQRLIDAFVSFATTLGATYDADPRIAVVQIGLVGFWGEWHTYPDMAWMPSVAHQDAIIAAFDAAFDVTQLELRTPAGSTPSTNMVGYHDDSFTYATLDGEHNDRDGETPIAWFVNREAATKGVSDAWMHSSIGGELRAENQATVFDSDFGSPATYKQDFSTCVAETHTSWLLNYHAFAPDLGYSGDALVAAQAGALAMGYQFGVQNVAACADTAKMDANTCDHGYENCALVTVTIQNDGVAPFYYDLAPVLEVADNCAGTGQTSIFSAGLMQLTDLQPGASRDFVFSVRGDANCVSNAGLRLQSAHAYNGKPVMLAHAHATSGSGVQVVALSMPDMPAEPSCSPTPAPSDAPTPSPTPLPSDAPITSAPSPPPAECETTFTRPEERGSEWPDPEACGATTMEKFTVECNRRPSFASGFLDIVDGLSVLQCADLCLRKFACKSFTLIPTNGRCQLYAKLYKKTAYVTNHNSKMLFRRTPCIPECPANVMDRFTRAAGFKTQDRPNEDSSYSFAYPAWSLADGASAPPRDAAGNWMAADTDVGYGGGYRPKNAAGYTYFCSTDATSPKPWGECTTVEMCAQACLTAQTARVNGNINAPKCGSFNFRMNQTAGNEQCKFYPKALVPQYLKEHSSSGGHKQYYGMTVGPNCNTP